MITREEARLQGKNRYFDGSTCKNGHVSERYVRDSYCCECKRIREIRQKQIRAELAKLRYAKDRKRYINKAKTYAQENAAEVAERQKNWRHENSEKLRKYRKDKNYIYAYHAAKRRKLVSLHTPSWADKTRMLEIYKECANITTKTGIKHHVDHIIPLSSDLVCGLHWEENLQIIDFLSNIRKSNKLLNLKD